MITGVKFHCVAAVQGTIYLSMEFI